ncbi:formamidopyrimidine-DNA glycosylase [Aureococcus anophagefferens]|nr:formamidopyrimidine-DNA glycosylase [Aureococcus anophagefferens]
MDARLGGGRYAVAAVDVVSGRYAERPPEGLAELRDRLRLALERVRCKGKFIYFELAGGASLWSTLGMSGGWTLRAGHPHARLALRLASDDDELVAYGTPDPRPKLRDLAPLGFSLEVGASVAGDGRAVRRDAGPHGRTLHWVEEAQTGAMPDSDEAAAAASLARRAPSMAWTAKRLRPPAASAGSASPARRPPLRRLTSGS